MTDTSHYQLLSRRRSDYDTELKRHRFLLDGYTGTGGFAGKERMPLSGYWGWAAEVYDTFTNTATVADAIIGEGQLHTYLDRHESEDPAKFQRRVSRSHYPNYIAPSIDIPLSFMHRKPLLRRPDAGGMGALEEWMNNANGAGEEWDDIKRDTILPRAAVLGWCPVLFDVVDLSAAVPGTALDSEPVTTRARNRESGRRVVARPLFPSNLLDWEHDQAGQLLWIKMCVKYTKRLTPLDPGTEVERFTIWQRNEWAWWEYVDGKLGKELVDQDDGVNPFGAVPLVVCRRKPVPDDPFRGIPMAGDATNEARRLFNALSELDEHLVNCAFAFLQVPTTQVTPGKPLDLGNGSALPIGHDWSQSYEWISPDPSVADTYEKRIASIIEEIYRMQRMEFTRGTKGGGARSGVSQAFEFEAANRAIADFARQDAKFDQRVLRLLSGLLSGPASERITVTAQQNYNVEEMATELEEALLSLKLDLGTYAEAEIKKKVVRSALPHLDDETRELIDEEIDELAERSREKQSAENAPTPAEQLAAARARLAELGEEDDDEEEEEDVEAEEGADVE